MYTKDWLKFLMYDDTFVFFSLIYFVENIIVHFV